MPQWLLTRRQRHRLALRVVWVRSTIRSLPSQRRISASATSYVQNCSARQRLMNGRDPFNRIVLTSSFVVRACRMHLARVPMRLFAAGAISIAAIVPSRAQPAPSGPPAVGVIEATKRPITESSEFLGRVEAVNRANVVARDTAFLEKRLFEEGAEVKQGDQLYQLERGPLEADLAAKKAQVAQLQATLENAKLTTEGGRILLSGPAGQQSTYDAAIANQRSLEAQVQAAQAQVKASQINLDYTDI